MATFSSSNVRLWKILTLIFIITTIILLVVVISLAATRSDDDDNNVETCGEGGNPNGYSLDLSDPAQPDVFHDLTEHELLQLRTFLEQDSQIKAAELGQAALDSSYIFAADLFLPNKSDVLRFLDQKSGTEQQPDRRARVMIFRGDLSPPVIEEHICGPLPKVASCELMQFEGRRNPAEYSLRPFNDMEFGSMVWTLLALVEKELGYILKESYGTTFFDCEADGICLHFTPAPLGTSLSGGIERRRLWLSGNYGVEFRMIHPVDFAVLLNMDSQNTTEWKVDRVWYAGRMYNSMNDLINGYNSSSIPITKISLPVFGPQLFSTLMMKDEPVPKYSQRPPKLVEPDGKRYSIKHRKVDYLNWSFHVRMSSFSGPALYDVRFKGERILYELALQEIAVFYSAHSPYLQTTDYIDSGGLLGTNSKALLLGSDCPETATYIGTKFMAQSGVKVAKFPRGMCIFEQNDGTPLRRKLSYPQIVGGFYGGMLNSALVVRSIISIGNYDYVVDYIFHQSGTLETRLLSTGYLNGIFYAEYEKKYGFKVHDHLGGNLHHHMMHFKVDLDVSGTANRYETIDFSPEDISLTAFPSQQYQINKYTRNLKETENEALFKYNFDTPKYHVFHNNAQRTKFNEMKAYKLQMHGMSKQLLGEGQFNEKSIPWARNQLVVTKHKDYEFWSTSSYAMWDSADPVVDFSQFYADNDNITDEDLVLWVTVGTHHLPRSEDVPLTTTVGNALTFFLSPYNYFTSDPSMSSRDAMRVNLKDITDRTKGVMLTRYQETTSQCKFPVLNLEKELEEDPDSMIESKRASPVF